MGSIRLKQIKDAKQLVDKVNKIENTIKNIANPSLDGYEKPSETSAVTENDSLQAAIGKVEAGIDTKLGKTETAVNALKVNNHTVESDVPANAVFTDTVYSEATAHDAGLLSASDKSKLDGIASGAQKNTVTGVKGGSESTYRTGNINITKENIGLGNVDNTADATKSVSYADNAGTVNGHEVNADVPSGAKFTDTTYSAMSSNEATTGTATTARTITAKVLADYVAACIANLVNSAPSTLDTLQELADALGNDPNFATTMATALGEKLGKTETAVNAAKVNNLTVQTAVPANAKFTDTTYSNFVKSGSGAKAGLVPAPSTTAGTTKYLREDGTWQVPPDNNTVYTHPTTSGNKHIPSGGSSGQILRWSADGMAVWGNDNNTTYSNVKGATTDADGTAGLVPAPAKGAANRYLRSDGTWQVPPDNNTTYTAASATPKANGTAAVGTSTKYAREDHVHPLQTSVSGSSGSCTGNAATATKATGDKNGNDITTTYVNLTGAQTISGVKTFTGKPILTNGLSMRVKDTNSTTTRDAQVLHANSSNTEYGINLAIGGNGNTIIGGGESYSAQLNALAGNSAEDLYLTADGNIYLKPNANTFANAKTITLNTAGELSGLAKVTATSFVGALTGNAATATKATQDKNGHDIATTYLPLAGGTMTGNLVTKNTPVTKGTNPTAVQYRSLAFTDNTGDAVKNRLGMLENKVNTNGITETYICAYNYTKDNTTSGRIAILNNKGTVYTEAPTPATADNSTKIATTAFVKAQGYITASGKAATAGTADTAKACTGNAATATKINGKTIAYVESFNATTGELKLKSLS